MDDERIAQLSSITGLDHEAASTLLEASGGDMDVAVQIHFNFEDRPAPAPPPARNMHGGEDEDEEDEDEEDEDDGFEEDEYEGEGADEDEDNEDERRGPLEPPVERGAVVPRLRWALGLITSLPGFALLQAVALRIGRLLLRIACLPGGLPIWRLTGRGSRGAVGAYAVCVAVFRGVAREARRP